MCIAVTPPLTKRVKKMGTECYYFVTLSVYVGINTLGSRRERLALKIKYYMYSLFFYHDRSFVFAV